MLDQFNGIVDGYTAAAPEAETLSRMQLTAYALQFEIGGAFMLLLRRCLFSHSGYQTTLRPPRLPRRTLCTAPRRVVAV